MRFIPAGAGNTQAQNLLPRPGSVYPRWRGEHISIALSEVRHTGLSPLARGTPPGIIPGSADLRFIPAGAGNTSTSSINKAKITVYPRWRGEHANSLRICSIVIGLSPLARGTLPQLRAGRSENRFIPAGAGNTPVISALRQSRPVYPRWRGEHNRTFSIPGYIRGLSPLARGTRFRKSHPDIRHRFIPAGAGNTALHRSYQGALPVYPRWRGEHVSSRLNT